MPKLRQRQLTDQRVPQGQSFIHRQEQPARPRAGHSVSQHRRRKATDLTEQLGIDIGAEEGRCFHQAAGSSVQVGQPAGADLGVAQRTLVPRHARASPG